MTRPPKYMILAALVTALGVAGPAAAPVAGAAERGTDVACGQQGAGQGGLSDPPSTTARYEVHLPSDYSSSGKRYPVLYVLAGQGEDERSAGRKLELAAFAREQNLIVVTPYGGGGFYTDWFNGQYCWERLYLDRLVPEIDARFRTRKERAHRAVAGYSMGGYGAMLWAARRPDLFVASGSMSGLVDITDKGEGGQLFVNTLAYDGGDPFAIWGNPESDGVWWHGRNPADLARNLRPLSLFATVGNGVATAEDLAAMGPSAVPASAIERTLHDQNQNFHAVLDAARIPHTFRVREGVHRSAYWKEEIRGWAGQLQAALGARAPSTFDYRSVDRRFSVWNWSFFADPARAPEFLQVAGASPSGLTLTGSGTTRVITEPLFDPGECVDLHQIGGSSRDCADREGRLSFVVDLGRPHAAQQYTSEAESAERAGGYFTTRTVRFGTLGRERRAGQRLRKARIRLSIHPRRVRAGAAVRFRFRATVGRPRGRRRGLRRARIRFAGKVVSTDSRGRAVIVRRLARAKRYRARVSKRGYRSGGAVVEARR